MQSILDAINEWIKEILIGAINGNLSTMFGDFHIFKPLLHGGKGFGNVDIRIAADNPRCAGGA